MKTKLAVLFLIAVAMLLAACSSMPNNAQAASNTAASPAPDPVSANASNGAAPAPFANNGAAPGTAAAATAPAVAKPLAIPAGTAVTVRLQNAVSSATSSPGDRFDAVLDAPVVVDGRTIAPQGAAVTGRVVSARRSGHLKDPGSIQLALVSMNVDGRAVPITTSSIIARGSSHTKRNWAMIGGGAGGGALIGGLVGGGKGALIGSAVGAGAGTTTAYATGKKDVGFGAERRLTFRLKDAAQIK